MFKKYILSLFLVITSFVSYSQCSGNVTIDYISSPPDTIACTRVYAPNSFTPDNDGVNDIFRVSGIGIYEPRLLIFDKWGNPFFETNDLYRGWNGDNGTGYYSEDGVYNWVIFYKDAQGVSKENNGYVILIR
jgi:gliding motility-associated-like protein